MVTTYKAETVPPTKKRKGVYATVVTEGTMHMYLLAVNSNQINELNEAFGISEGCDVCDLLDSALMYAAMWSVLEGSDQKGKEHNYLSICICICLPRTDFSFGSNGTYSFLPHS